MRLPKQRSTLRYTLSLPRVLRRMALLATCKCFAYCGPCMGASRRQGFGSSISSITLCRRWVSQIHYTIHVCIVWESVKLGRRIRKWSNFSMEKPISKVGKCGQILWTGQIFRSLFLRLLHVIRVQLSITSHAIRLSLPIVASCPGRSTPPRRPGQGS